jgi:uncharacterized protein (TIGR01777 family)
MSAVKVVVAGASGFIGSALVPALRAAGHEVLVLVRRPAGAGELQWDPAAGTLDRDALAGVDAGICLSGAGLGDHRWSDAYRGQILASRLETAGLLAITLAGLDPKPAVLLSASGIGWYGDQGDTPVDETWPTPGPSFTATVADKWEQAATPASDAGIRVCLLRTGLVQDPSGGALGRQLPLFRLGLGGALGSGRQWQSWITREDEVRAILFLLTAEVAGPVNLTSPHPVRQKDLARALGRALHRPSILPVPGFALRLVLGAFSSEVVASQRVLPRVLEQSGFSWTSPDAVGAFSRILN